MMRAMRLDAALGLLTALAVVTGTALTGVPVTHAGTVPLACLLGALLLLRRRWPVPVLAASMTVIVAFGGGDLGTPGWVWPATAAYATVVLAGGLRWALGIGVINLSFVLTFAPSQTQIGAETLWLGLVLAATQAYLSHRAAVDLDARGRLAEERLQVARELHDVVAHTLAVVGIHLNVAAEALDDDPDEARAALRLAQSVRGQAMTDLRSLVGVLRAEPPPDTGPDLAGLVERTGATGLDVRLDGDTAGLPAPVALTVHRVVQEGLTNVLKHAAATHATVTITKADDAVTVTVADDGTGGGGGRVGHGIDGMRERVAALGGTLTAGPRDGGFELRARIPLP